MRKVTVRLASGLFILFAHAFAAPAAEFDLDSGRVVLRQLQYCRECGAALLVTQVHPGTLVRCPDCGHEEPRLDGKYLLTQLYQLCKICQGPLDPRERRPGEVVECGNCRARQPLSRDAFAKNPHPDGLGYVPGFPPGTGKKRLLFSPSRPDARVTVIPLDNNGVNPDLPLPPESGMRRIPRPPVDEAASAVARADAPKSGPPPLPEPPPTSTGFGGRDKYASLNPSLAGRSADGAVDVPAVTAELFGVKRPDAGPDAPGAYSPGAVVARVDGEPIHARDVSQILDPVLNRLRRQAASAAETEAVNAREETLRREILERLIDRELVMREADAIGYRPDPAAVRERETELAQILAGTGADVAREAVRDVTMTDMRRRYAEKPGSANPAAVREFYAQHKHEMLRPRLVALDQLVIYEERTGKSDARSCRDIALEVSRLLESGEKFDALRQRYDEFAPGAGVEHSAPSLLPEEAYSRQVLQSGGELRRGAVFGPLFLPGMAIFGKVTDERPAGPVPFEEVEKNIRSRLESESTEQNLDAWLKRLRAKTRIEIM